jgi:hypothetical protein
MWRGAARTGLFSVVHLSSEHDPQSSESRRPTPADDTTIVSWPACVAIVVLLLALFFVAPHF